MQSFFVFGHWTYVRVHPIGTALSGTRSFWLPTRDPASTPLDPEVLCCQTAPTAKGGRGATLVQLAQQRVAAAAHRGLRLAQRRVRARQLRAQRGGLVARLVLGRLVLELRVCANFGSQGICISVYL